MTKTKESLKIFDNFPEKSNVKQRYKTRSTQKILDVDHGRQLALNGNLRINNKTANTRTIYKQPEAINAICRKCVVKLYPIKIEHLKKNRLSKNIEANTSQQINSSIKKVKTKTTPKLQRVIVKLKRLKLGQYLLESQQNQTFTNRDVNTNTDKINVCTFKFITKKHKKDQLKTNQNKDLSNSIGSKVNLGKNKRDENTSKVNGVPTKKIIFSSKKNPAKTNVTKTNHVETVEDINHIYDFIPDSQPQKDVMADVVKKMIKQGKCRVVHKKRQIKPPENKSKSKKSKQNKNKENIKKVPKEVSISPKPKVNIISVEILNPISTEVLTQPCNNTHDDKNKTFDELANSLYDTPKITVSDKREKNLAKMIIDRRYLLKRAREIVKETPPANVEKNNNEESFKHSTPWRVGKENIPRTFYFSRSEDNLPSFSSDYFPASQEENNVKRNLNLSNLENISPITKLPESARQKNVFTNPRLLQANRTPLKSINVFNLPALARSPPKKNGRFVSPEITQNNDSIKDNSLLSLDVTNCFGFDDKEFEETSPVKKPIKINKSYLKEKLKSLKRLRPSIPNKVDCSTIQKVLKSPSKQKKIYTMLSSTLINNASESRKFEETAMKSRNYSMDETDVNLFSDCNEPVSTFDLSTIQRTYERPKRFKKKRKNFILWALGEDEDEDEDDDDDEDRYTEDDGAAKMKTKKKRKPKAVKKLKEIKIQEELDSFVQDFASICEEIDKYELIVE